MYAFGSAEKGQLGNGRTGEHIVSSGKVVFDAEWEPCQYSSPPFYTVLPFIPSSVPSVGPAPRREEDHPGRVRATAQCCAERRRVSEMAKCPSRSLRLTEYRLRCFRMVYVWGCNGYGRMGLGTGLQQDVLFPKFVPQVREVLQP